MPSIKQNPLEICPAVLVRGNQPSRPVRKPLKVKLFICTYSYTVAIVLSNTDIERGFHVTSLLDVSTNLHVLPAHIGNSPE